MKLDDDRWNGLLGGYRIPYDPRPALQATSSGDSEAAWDELWQNLHHQGDVDSASYAAVPEIVRLIARASFATWRAYGLLAVIEESRLCFWRSNPPVPSWLEDDYRHAWQAILEPALRHYAMATEAGDVESILAVLAFAKGQRSLGMIALLTQGEREEMLSDLLGWRRDERDNGKHRPGIRGHSDD